MITKNEKKQFIAFIESNTTGTGQLFIKESLAQGFNPIFITKNPNKYPFLNELLLQPVILNTSSFEELSSYLSTIENLAGIFSSSDYFVEIASQLAYRFSLLGSHPEAVKICRNKNLLTKKLTENNISCPRSIAINSSDLAKNAMIQSRLEFPVIIKPVQGTGSMGVKLCHNLQELIAHIDSQLKELNESSPDTDVLLIQEYIEGEEFSVETFTANAEVNIIGITQKHLSNPPYFVETGHDFPAVLPHLIEERICSFIKMSLEKINLLFGPAHTEVRIKNGMPYLIEINPRLAGGMIPLLINFSTGIDLIAMTIKLVTGQQLSFAEPFTYRFASIRFIIPAVNGLLESVQINHLDKKIVDYQIYKKFNETIHLQGDFRDRIGHVIIKEDDFNACKELADAVHNSITININSDFNSFAAFADTGRLKSTLMPEAQALIHNEIQFDQANDLTYLLQIDEAHIIMLYKGNIISLKHAQMLLDQIRKLRHEDMAFFNNLSTPRGLYLSYENYMIEKLGSYIGGLSHIGRSRNDINATLFKMKIRNKYFSTFKKLWQLRSCLLNQSQIYVHTLLPIYSQYQTALPGTLAHYLLGIETALSRDQLALKVLSEDINACPLGACAGGGTTFAIDQNIIARYLGFTSYMPNSIDAVASRDLALRILAVLVISAMNLSRIITDLQLWSTNEFGFIKFPDNLCGGSSMMPQKKNPFLLEKIQGRLSTLQGHLTSANMTMFKVPFGNSVEVGTESIKNLDLAFHNFDTAISLLIMHFKNMNINSDVIKNSLLNHYTFATYITEQMVKNGEFSFREAHHFLGNKINIAINDHCDPSEGLLTFLNNLQPFHVDLLNIAHEMNYGGGPGVNSTRIQYFQALKRMNDDSEWINVKIKYSENADIERNTKIANLIAMKS